MREGFVIEWAPFRLAAGATEAELLAASAELQAGFLGRQPGFVRRELLRGDGGWADLVYWTDRAAADRAMQAVAGSAACQRYFALLADVGAATSTGPVAHFACVASYGPGEPAA